MSALPHPDIAARGDRRLLGHCLHRFPNRPPVHKRLELALGPELTELLLFALARQPGRLGQGRRGSSSP